MNLPPQLNSVTKQSVLLISSNSSGRGGGERYLVFLAKGLKEEGLDVHVLLSDVEYMDGWAQNFLEDRIVVHRAHLKGLAQRPLRFLQALLDRKQIENVAELCRSIVPDAILVNQQYDEDGLDYVQGALLSRSGRVVGVIHMPMTASKHSRPLGRLRGGLLRNWYRNHGYEKVFVSEGARQEFNDYYRLDQVSYVVNNSVPMSLVGMEKNEPSLPSGKKIIGFIGQFVAQKNLGCVIDIWKDVRNRGIDAGLLLVGDGPERNRVEKMLADCQSETWCITGWTECPEIYLHGMDIFVLASHFEGLPLSLVEAASRGIVCVTAPFNGATDVAKLAPWVRISQDNDVGTMANLLYETIQNLDDLQSTVTTSHLADFQNYFSLNRMVKEIREILELI